MEEFIEYLGNKPILVPKDEYITEGVWESRLIIQKENIINDVNIGISIINKTQRQQTVDDSVSDDQANKNDKE